MEYYLIYILSILNVLLLYKENKELYLRKFSFNFFFLFSIIIIIFSSTRYEVGSDYDAYHQIYNSITSGQDILIDPSFKFLVLFFKHFNRGFEYLIFFYSSLSIFLFLNLIYKYSYKYEWSLLIFLSYYYFIFYFGLMRQGLAIVLILNLVLNTSLTKIQRMSIFIISVIIHASTVVYLFFYFFSKIRLTKLKIYILLLIAFFVGFYTSTYNFTLASLSNNNYFLSKINLYLNDNGKIGLLTILELLLFLVTIYNAKSISKNIQYYTLGILLKLFFIKFSVIGWRISLLYLPIVIFVFPNTLLYCNSNKQYNKIIILCYSLAYFYVTIALHLRSSHYMSLLYL